MQINLTDDNGQPVNPDKGLFDKNGKQYWILLGLIQNNTNLVCDGSNLESEVEAQAEQLFNFIHRQIPCSVADRLVRKIKNGFYK